MTAEAVVMNKSAVAMAADSAVTISSGRQGLKTFETVNKLFELVRGRPVGFMIYANAELNGMPWETVLKAFREENRGLSLPYLEDYVAAFEDYVKNNRDLIDKTSETRLVVDNAYNSMIHVFAYVRARQDTCVTKSGNLVMTRVRALIDDAIDACEARHTNWGDAPWAVTLDAALILKRHGSAIAVLVDELFKEYGLSKTTRGRLKNLAISYLTRLAPDPAASGVVISGFGERDYFPKVHSVRYRGILEGSTLAYDPEFTQITREYPGHLGTFAQDEEAQAFILGVSPEVRELILEFWGRDWVRGGEADISEVLNKFGYLSDDQRQEIAEAVFGLTHDRVHQFLHLMQTHQDSRRLEPFWKSISLLPKDELGVLAESLVNLTSLKQRMSIQNVATVGGAIDVALISKGDGFVWLKRKHYFSPDLNPSWHLTHHGNVK